ncbi:MAG: c-type cytochrome biogenesis protein CcmI [Pseudomonas sp.]|uniref:c-type cytochrome biogenesis protein CcmI n=1 Tax=Pseudomonas sp. TaxID=306 RepID=UPI00271B7739|nr:c-type cytochrome biogenesis protein CcmI [Pseudomonas sp.]MDO9616766.1 c-type cytochrome biogenesis protein CcmI [Pseudomonas sp.]MDP2446326.1 c-type cytochrome biogenesis protein CcmI [Pseudomonas sp.]MDZ4333845.1 c-type cytochrome biogenesis protein CcmI [Pseudomonas sp.]
MIEFWLCAGLLLLTALAFLLIPVLRARKVQAEEDRTALNVTLYQERLLDLQGQHDAGALNAEQLANGRDEAARELLADTEGAQAQRTQRTLGSKIPLIAALLMPLLGYGLYQQWGAIDDVERAHAFAQQPKTIEEMTARLEAAVKNDPKSAESWYFLGRTYMAQERATDAAVAFERAIDVAGREPELLGQWAQALYFSGDKQWTEQLQALTDEALKADPAEVTSLGLLGIAAYEAGQFQQAIERWQQLVAVLPAEDPSRMAIQGGIDRAREQLGAPAADAAPATNQGLTVRVALATELQAKVQPGDAVFIFARAVSGPPMPLAVKRLTVADLPAKVSLSDSDAMMPQLKISGFEQVQLVARISRSGNATAGEWIGSSQPLASKTTELQQLLIDSADSKAP